MADISWLMQYAGEGKWGRRRPRWLMVERAYLHNLWRASQAAHKGWATQDNPSVPLSCIPPMHKVGLSLPHHACKLPSNVSLSCFLPLLRCVVPVVSCMQAAMASVHSPPQLHPSYKKGGLMQPAIASDPSRHCTALNPLASYQIVLCLPQNACKPSQH